jgi:glycosyltransferase involved in cell wall biosynthesis
MSHIEISINRDTTQQPVPERPIVSFGVPVRNGEKYLPRLFDSLLAQDFSNFEVIIGDNLSDDRTEDICREYARRDPRIKYVRHEENLGQNGNFNRVFELSQGKYFRWIGDDDWLEPAYTRKCVEFLETHPDFGAVTTEQDHVFDNGTSHYKEYRGKRCDSPLPYLRFNQMLWLLTADYGFIDPIYTLYRREMILQSRGMQVIPAQDHVLATELSLVGRFGHIPECLAHRRRNDYQAVGWSNLLKHYEPKNFKKMQGELNLQAAFAMWEFVQKSSLPIWQKLFCLIPIIRYVSVITWRKVESNVRGKLRLRTRLRLALFGTDNLA